MTERTDEELRAAVERLADSRLDALRSQAYRDTALELLVVSDSVTRDQVEAALAERWAPPTDDILLDQVAAKCVAAVNYHARVAAEAESAVEATRAKITRYEELLNSVRDQVSEAERRLVEARRELADAEALAVVAARLSGRPVPESTGSGSIVATETAVVGLQTPTERS